MGSQSGPLWAITAYFNPARYRQRRHNYGEFRRRLSAPLLTVELGYDGRFELGNGDADVLIRVGGRDVVWQKERLLNIGLRALPSECRYVAWLDCDVVFERSDWTEATCRALDGCPVVHLFREVYELGRTELAEAPRGSGMKGMSILAVAGAEEDPGELLRGNMRGNHSVHSGLAWAARRDVLADGLYDACIVGSGNRAILCAQLGRFSDAIHYLHMGPRWQAHYLSWAERQYERIQGSVEAIEGRLIHLWHGCLDDRRYAERHTALARFDFDPAVDIEQAEEGAWQWSSDKPEMHRYVRRYFWARNEDGREPRAGRGREG